LSEHEKDPAWLKNKGNSLFKQGNFDSAAHAYSMALKITPKNPNLFLNRAAAYQQLRKLHKAVSDCQAAIDLLQPAVDDNKSQRAKAFSRRGAAFLGLEMYKQALEDTQHAYDLTRDARILRDAEKIKCKLGIENKN